MKPNHSQLRGRYYRTILVGVGLVYTIMQLIMGLFKPNWPFGIGLPSEMALFTSGDNLFSFEYPKKWVASYYPQGNHGDFEDIADASIPGFGYIRIYITRKIDQVNSLEEAFTWGELRVSQESLFQTIKITNTSLDILHEYSYQIKSYLGTSSILCKARYSLFSSGTYGITGCTEMKFWNEVLPYFEKSLNSFEAK